MSSTPSSLCGSGGLLSRPFRVEPAQAREDGVLVVRGEIGPAVGGEHGTIHRVAGSAEAEDAGVVFVGVVQAVPDLGHALLELDHELVAKCVEGFAGGGEGRGLFGRGAGEGKSEPGRGIL